MSGLFGNHIVGFSTRRLKYYIAVMNKQKVFYIFYHDLIEQHVHKTVSPKLRFVIIQRQFSALGHSFSLLFLAHLSQNIITSFIMILASTCMCVLYNFYLHNKIEIVCMVVRVVSKLGPSCLMLGSDSSWVRKIPRVRVVLGPSCPATGELIGWPCSVVRPSVVRPSVVRPQFQRNRLADQSQTSCGASLGRGNESLYKWSRSHDQDGRHGYK